MHVPAGGLSRGVQAHQPVDLSLLLRPDSSHAVVLGRSNGDKLLHRIDTQELMAYRGDLPEVGIDMPGPKVPDIQPQVRAVRAFDAQPFTYMRDHPAAHHVPGGQLLLFRLVAQHKPVQVFVQEVAPVAAARLADKDIPGHNARGVELYGFHVAQGHHPGVHSDGHSTAFVDYAVGRASVDTAMAARGYYRGPRQVRTQLSGT